MTAVADKHDANALRINGRLYLLVGVGQKTHLVAHGDEDEPDLQPAVPDWAFEQEEDWQDHYNVAALRSRRWRGATLCGREWAWMRDAGAPTGIIRDDVHAPDCRSCIRIVSKQLQSTDPAEGLYLVAELAVETMVERGEVMVVGVPPDQAERLRDLLRKGLRTRKLRGGTYLLDSGTVMAWAEVFDPKSEEVGEQVRRALDRVFRGEPPERERPVVDWRTWQPP